MFPTQIITLLNPDFHAIKHIAHFINILLIDFYLHFKKVDYILNTAHILTFSPFSHVHAPVAASTSCTDYNYLDDYSSNNYRYPTNTTSVAVDVAYVLLSPFILFSKFSAILAHFCLFTHRMLLIYFVASPKDVQLICSTSGLKYWQKSQKSWSIKLNPSTFMPHIPCRYIQNRLICRITISVI